MKQFIIKTIQHSLTIIAICLVFDLNTKSMGFSALIIYLCSYISGTLEATK